MSFKSLQAFNIEEDCVRLWAEDLNPDTAKNYVHCSLRYEGHRSTGKPRKRYEAHREVVRGIRDPCHVRPDEVHPCPSGDLDDEALPLLAFRADLAEN